jgi:hypothetical protein
MAKQKGPILKGNPTLFRADGTQEEVRLQTARSLNLGN